MFEALGQRFSTLFSGLRGKVTQPQLVEFVQDIKSCPNWVWCCTWSGRYFSAKILEKFQEQSDAINTSTNPSQKIFEIVNNQLTQTLGGNARRLQYAKNASTVILLTGLQGAGKTSLAGKLANYLKDEGNTPLLVAADLQRPNAVTQLQIVGQSIKIPVFAPEPGNGVGDPVGVARASLKFASENYIIL